MDEKFWIATVDSRMDKKMKAYEVTWPAFLDMFREPIMTKETIQEYASMSSDIKADAKDVGGVIPGRFLWDKRKEAVVEAIRVFKT
jgi:hypothetical protein